MRVLVFLIVFMASCANKSGDQTPANADTTQVIELALKTALGEHFPEMDDVKRLSQPGDSIFFTTELFSLSNLPTTVDSFKFRILPDSLICPLIKADTSSIEIPNYLRLQTFQKTDTGYFVEFESVVCVPRAARDASVSIHILKTRDKFEFKGKN